MTKMLTSSLYVCVRCLMAAARSCLTSTRQLTRCTDRRDWLLPLTDTLWSPIPGTTALKSTATCSSGSSPSAHKLCTPRGHTLTRTLGCRTNPGRFCTRPPSRLSSRRRAICLTHLHTSVCCITSERWTESEAVSCGFCEVCLAPAAMSWWIAWEESVVLFPKHFSTSQSVIQKPLCSYLLLTLKVLAVLLLVARCWRCGM